MLNLTLLNINSHRLAGITAVGFSAAALSVALLLQTKLDWYPCALCIVQRYAYVAVFLGGIWLWMLGAHANTLRGVGYGVTAAGILAGLSAALYHVWVLANPGQTCGVDPLQLKLNALPWVSWWPTMFESDGLCTDPYPPFLGLTLPAWSAIGFATVAAAIILVAYVLPRSMPTKQSPSAQKSKT